MSNIFNNVRINNIYHDLKNLEETVAGLIAGGGGGTITSDLSLNDHSLIDVDTIQFSPSGTLTVADDQLTFNNEPIGGVQNPLTSNLNCNNLDLTNVHSVQFQDVLTPTLQTYFYTIGGGLSSVNGDGDGDDTRLYIYINETSGKPYFTDYRGYPITNVSSIEITQINFGSDTLAVNDDNIEYNGSIMMTAANVNDYVTGGGSGGWVNTATSSLSMANYQINNISELDFGPGKVVTPDSANNLTYKNEMVVVRPKLQPTYDLADGATISMGNNTITLPPVTIPNSDINFSGSFQLVLDMVNYQFELNNNYLIGVGVKTHTTQANVFTNGTMILFDSSSFTDSGGTMSGTTITFNSNSPTGTGGVFTNNLGSPLSTSEDYEFYVIFSSKTGDDDCSCSNFNLSLKLMDSDVYGDLDIGANGLIMDNTKLQNVGGNLIWNNNKTLLTNQDGYFKPGAINLNMGNYAIQNILNLQFPNPQNANLPHSIEVSSQNRLQADGYDIVNSNNIGGYCGWDNGIAKTTISLSGQQIQGVDEIAFQDTSILTVSGGSLTYKNQQVLTAGDIVNPTSIISGKATSTIPFQFYVPIDTNADASYCFSGTVLGLNFGLKFSTYVQYSAGTTQSISPVNISQLADLSDDTYNDLTVTWSDTYELLVTVSVNNNVLSGEYESITAWYKIKQASFIPPS